MNGYTSHTYMWVNAAGERFWVKYHFKTDQGIETSSPRRRPTGSPARMPTTTGAICSRRSSGVTIPVGR